MTINVDEVKRRLSALLKDDNLVMEYIRNYGPNLNMQHIKEIKEKGSSNQIESPENQQEGKDPIFEIKLDCPICGQKDIVGYDMRSKSQQVIPNLFLVPDFEGTSGYRSVDFTKLSTTVCPRCLFASPDKKDFIRPDATNPERKLKSQLPSNVMMTLQEKIGERKAVLRSITDIESHFKRPRSVDASIDSIKLSISRANIEAWYELPYSYFKLGSYMLRIAKLMKEKGVDNRESLREALSYLEESFKTSNAPSEDIEMQVVYLIVAIYLKLGEQKKANSYIAVFTNLKNQRLAEMKENPSLNLNSITKWSDKAKYLWEDRDRADLFEKE